MKTTLKNATGASRNGYISNHNSIHWIVGELLNMPLIDFRCTPSEILWPLLAEFMRDSGMNEFRAHQVTFGEMLPESVLAMPRDLAVLISGGEMGKVVKKIMPYSTLEK